MDSRRAESQKTILHISLFKNASKCTVWSGSSFKLLLTYIEQNTGKCHFVQKSFLPAVCQSSERWAIISPDKFLHANYPLCILILWSSERELTPRNSCLGLNELMLRKISTHRRFEQVYRYEIENDRINCLKFVKGLGSWLKCRNYDYGDLSFLVSKNWFERHVYVNSVELSHDVCVRDESWSHFQSIETTHLWSINRFLCIPHCIIWRNMGYVNTQWAQ